MEDQKEDLKKLYWDGNLNHAMRYWWYLNKGIDVFNQFKYVFALLFGVYFTLKLHNPFLLLAMGLISLPILTAVGWMAVHKLGKVVDYLNVHFSTHWTRYNFELLEKQVKALEAINAKMVNT